MKRDSFLTYLEKNLVLFDGAMGTYIYQKGIFIDKCYDALNLSNPDLIQKIHEEYLHAGAHVIETNTFGANPYQLRKHNLQNELHQINRRGAEIARSAAGDGFVAGSMGPLGQNLHPWGEITAAEARKAFREQAAALLQGNIDLFILETFQNLNELEEAVRAVRETAHLPLIAQLSLQEDGRTIFGNSLEEIAEHLNVLDVDVIGLNCVLGPKQLLDELEKLIHYTAKPVSIMPNAGLPQRVDGRMFYMSTPDYFGVYAKRFIDAGARIIGGCCGTSPEHIRKMAEVIAQKQTRLHRQDKISLPPSGPMNLPDPVPIEKKSKLAAKIHKNGYVALVEMVSPKGTDITRQIEGAEKCKAFGIDAINIPDGPRASARMNGLALAVKLQETVGIETVLHYTCRDRNLLGIQSDLLGASLLGIKNILAITGDPPKMGDYPDATAVFDIDSIGLARFISNLNHGLDIGHNPIGSPTGFLLGVGVDPSSINIALELDRFRQKIDAGAEFAITQPVFDINTLERFLDKASRSAFPVIAGIWPLISMRNAEFMKNEVPGVHIPDDILKRISQYGSKEDQLKAGIEIAREMAVQVKSFTQGIQISAPFGRVQIALDVAETVI
ncbi:bifunctional homocysteine S-methyltransferase/methylenetetrahydrofolate reductase [bacterium]|nr:bifunctional homocysteine S-methyltransferase/methylenetetrahydrofolate reductase [bacterium]